MILLVCILLSIPIGYAIGGKLRNVQYYSTRMLGLPIIAFLLEGATGYLQAWIQTPIAQWHWILVTIQYLLLFLFCYYNRHEKPIWIIAVACFLNFFVIAWYGFQMPLPPYVREIPQMAATVAKIDTGEYFRYTIANEGDLFWFLGDVILIPLKRIGGLASIGDVLLGIGCGWMVCTWMKLTPPQNQTKAQQE